MSERLRCSVLTVLLGAAVLLAGCAPAEPPPVVSVDQACTLNNDGEAASVVGYFQTDFMVFCTDSCTLGFSDTPDGQSALSPDVKVGSGNNQMRELPDNFQESDFQVTTQDGATLGLNDRVQLSGRMSIATDVCLMYVEQIRAAS